MTDNSKTAINNLRINKDNIDKYVIKKSGDIDVSKKSSLF